MKTSRNPIRRLAIAGVAAAILAAGCAEGAPSANHASPAAAHEAAAQPAATTTTKTTTTTPGSNGSGSTAVTTTASGAGAGAAASKLPPIKLPWKSTLNMDAVVSPACVTPGGLVTITITTKPKAGIAYQAMYADGKGGSQAPFGAGYGGNDKGFTNDDGKYTSAWTVSPNAPSGTGRIDVIGGWHGQWGYRGPAFAVAGPSGPCCCVDSSPPSRCSRPWSRRSSFTLSRPPAPLPITE